MRTPLRLTAATIAAATLIGAAAAATAEPATPSPIADGTGSSALDSGSTAAGTAVWYAQHGDIIGLLVLLASTPFGILTSGICDLASISGLRNPCSTATR
ncbi:hypothetical protein [Nocardia bovistercoris]|uniref:Secreted protein n=1 Tax=Nocardia bovistercoris TaxID=2785916 RepID=A0A931N2M1_9NOCA|nr:hypothetical protein [Nocardia bovistercoris]MBH0776196.1 hypothetical protein [Nocardia bovistercoris]